MYRNHLTLGSWRSYLRGLTENHEPTHDTKGHYTQPFFEKFVSPFLKPHLGDHIYGLQVKGQFPEKLISLLFFYFYFF